MKQKRYRKRKRKHAFLEKNFHFNYFLKECRGLRADHDGTPLLARFFIDQYDELLQQGYERDTIESLLQRLILLVTPSLKSSFEREDITMNEIIEACPWPGREVDARPIRPADAT